MNKKPYIVLLSIFCLLLIIVFGMLFIKDINTKYIIFADGNHLKYDGNWSTIDNGDIPNKKYKIIKSGNIIAENNLSILDEEIYAGNIEIISDTIAYRGSNMENKYYEEKEFDETDYSYLNQILNQKGINIDSHQLSFLYKYEIDLNNDENKETVYAVANHYNINLGQLFSLVIVKNNQIIDFSVFETEFDAYVPYLYFIGIDKKANIIFKNTYASMIGQDIKIISFDKNLNYEIIFEEDAK